MSFHCSWKIKRFVFSWPSVKHVCMFIHLDIRSTCTEICTVYIYINVNIFISIYLYIYYIIYIYILYYIMYIILYCIVLYCIILYYILYYILYTVILYIYTLCVTARYGSFFVPRQVACISEMDSSTFRCLHGQGILCRATPCQCTHLGSSSLFPSAAPRNTENLGKSMAVCKNGRQNINQFIVCYHTSIWTSLWAVYPDPNVFGHSIA